MTVSAALALLLLPALQNGGLTAEAGATARICNAWAEDHALELVELYESLHAAPELSFYEFKTAERMAATLRNLGFEVTEGVGGTGVVGVLKNGRGPTVLVRTDMDALPITEVTGLDYASKVRVKDESGVEVGVMHACGHDVHMTVWTGAAGFMAANKDKWSGTLVFIAQPAEERGAGAREMIADGLLKRFPRPDYTFAFHVDGYYPAGKLAFTAGYCYANVDSVDIVVKGRGGHGSRPHTTHDPVALAARIVTGLQTIVSREVDPQAPAVVTVGSIHGGTKHNIIPERVKLQITVRTYTDAVRDQVLKAIERVALGEALAAGFPEHLMPEVTAIEREFTPAAYNDPALVGRINAAFIRTLGPGVLMDKVPSMGGEDFGRYAKSAGVPGYMFAVGTAPPALWKQAQKPGATRLASTHNADYAPAALASIRTGVTAMTAGLMELLGK